MASYFLNVVCARNSFLGIHIYWNYLEVPMHVYFLMLWENKYKKYYRLICVSFLSQLYFVIFRKECLRVTDHTKKMINYIGDWYLEDNFTYIKIYDETMSPHIFPKYVQHRLDVGEISSQTILQGFNTTFIIEKKVIPYGIVLGNYFIMDPKHVRKEVVNHLENRFQTK
jgi:hypothetical protein